MTSKIFALTKLYPIKKIIIHIGRNNFPTGDFENPVGSDF